MATPAINGSSIPAAEACPAEIREILHAAASGEELTFEQGLILATAEGSVLEALVVFADQLRRETVSDAITYVVNRNIISRMSVSSDAVFAALDVGSEHPTPTR